MAKKRKGPAEAEPEEMREAEEAVAEDDGQSEEELALAEAAAEQPDEIELEMYRVVPDTPRIRAMIYSEPGGGKTTLAASAQDHDDLGPVVFANIEGGLLSVAHRGDIHGVDIRSTDELYALYRQIKNKISPFGETGTLVIDNMSELQTANLDEIVQVAMNSGKPKDRNRDSADDIWQEDYGVSTTQLLRLIRWFRNLDMNLIVTAHAKYVYPPKPKNARNAEIVDAEPIAVLPMLSQKLCKGVMGMMDFVWYLEYDAEDNVRRMLTRPDGIRQAKTRGPLFAEALGNEKGIVTNPTMPELFDLLVQSNTGKKPTTKKRGK